MCIYIDAIEQFSTKDKETTIDTNLEVVQEMKQAMSIVNDNEDINQNTELQQQNNNNNVSTQTSTNDDLNKNNDKNNNDKKDETEIIEKNKDESKNFKQEETVVVTDAPTKISTASADVLLPLLIFTIVKSNPTNFVSNLKFIQRFRRPNQLSGQANYCFTNIVSIQRKNNNKNR